MEKGELNMIIGVDFDGTCVTHNFPNVGKNIGAEIVLKSLCDAGHEIICITMRSDKDEEEHGVNTVKEAKKWFKDNDIKLYAFNDNPGQNEWSSSRKIYAHLYIDDRLLGCPLCYHKSYGNKVFVNWYRVCLYLNLQGLLSDDETKKAIKELVNKHPNIYIEN